ncbi:MAG TPA: transglutaminase domain-containing protein [Dehalococcoidia bacterium]|nr:transglutaminase domain-containing protein [Dehalococcoidia bacterium]
MSILGTVGTPTAAQRVATPAREALFPWRDGVTLVIVFAVATCVVSSIDNADWVEGVPSLHPIALFGLALGYVLARLPWRAIFLYPLALLLGASGLLVQVLAVTPGDNLKERYGEMVLRMRLWLDALTGGGISSDALPVIVLLLVLTWLTAWFLAWSIFRWNNPWIGLVPGGLALLMNISYLPGQSSPAFAVFVIAAILLVSRTHFDSKMKEWRRTQTPYPGSLHFFSMNQTLWAALVLVAAAWLVPLAGQAGPFPSVWGAWTEPVADQFAGLSRVFSAVQGKKGLPLDRYASFLPYRGYFEAVQGPIMTIKASEAGLWRATVYDVYTPSGWKTGKRDKEPLEERSTDLPTALETAGRQQRQAAAIEVVVDEALPVFVAPGDALAVNREADVETAGDPSDVTSLRPSKPLKQGDHYIAVGLVSVASIDALRSSGGDYPSWVTDRYLQLPDGLLPSIAELAREATRNDPSAYDKASSIEEYLRRYPVELQESAPPSDTDAVAFFLFEQQRGHPLYHASAMVVLLRTLGIPSRLAVGFAIPQTSVSVDGTYAIDGRNALAWPEVYFSGLGWIPFSPSSAHSAPATGPADSPVGPAGPISAQDLLDMFPAANTGTSTTPEADAGTSPAENAGGGQMLPWLITPFVLLLALSLASAAGFRYSWNRSLSGLSRPAQMLEKTRRLSSWAGVGPRPSETPREFIRQLRETLPEEPDLPALSNAYEQVEFRRRPLSDEEGARLDALWKRLRPRLLRRILRRRTRIGGAE